MKNFEPTHFTVQLNSTPDYKHIGNDTMWNENIGINFFDSMMDHYKKLRSVQPVAIFKIQFKKQSA
jgi:hypothetical protein